MKHVASVWECDPTTTNADSGVSDDVKSIVLDSVVEDVVLADLDASFFLVLFPGFPQSKHWVAESSSLSYVQ